MFPQSFHLRSATRQTISDGDISQTLRSGRQWAVNGDIFVTRKPCFKSNTSGEEERPHCKLGYFVFQKNATITAVQAASFLILIKFENANYVHLIYEPIRPPKCMCHGKFVTPSDKTVNVLKANWSISGAINWGLCGWLESAAQLWPKQLPSPGLRYKSNTISSDHYSVAVEESRQQWA